ncbi:CBS domain-containing protein [Daejeonella oryzae]|uniref:CBS domain-containing protein n=1 Tax=Daejeonella oryzae TaxID=1122943 RepID=UPI000420E987|nr:CBS domain-containing protein [Daejeonella oryzae]
MGKVRNVLKAKSSSTISISPDNSVFEALELMVEKNIGALLVIEQTTFTGIFTERDYARKIILKGKASKDTPIREIMTPNPITVNLDTTIEECMHIMTNKFIRHLPVMEKEELIGIISIGDVVKYIIDEQKFIIQNLEHYIAGT